MAIGVDTSKWKPRKIKGTPSHVFRNRLAYGIIGVSTALGLYFHLRESHIKKLVDKWYVDPIEEIERKQIIGAGFGTRTAGFIRRKAEEESQPNQPHI